MKRDRLRDRRAMRKPTHGDPHHRPFSGIMRDMFRVLVMAVIACSAGGCVTAPWTRLSLTGGGAIQRFSPADPVAGDARVDGTYVFRSEIDFLQLMAPEARDFDVGIGYSFIDLPAGQRIHEARSAATAAGRYHIWIERYEDGSIVRVSIGGNADVLFYGNGFGGGGATLTLDLEVATRTVFWSGGGGGGDDNGAWFGFGSIAPGEAGIGLRAEAGFHVLDDGTQRWLVTAGFIARIPAFGFFGLIIPSHT
jgi:hypothetical protein